jgi:hypothetical protein
MVTDLGPAPNEPPHGLTRRAQQRRIPYEFTEHTAKRNEVLRALAWGVTLWCIC